MIKILIEESNCERGMPFILIHFFHRVACDEGNPELNLRYYTHNLKENLTRFEMTREKCRAIAKEEGVFSSYE